MSFRSMSKGGNSFLLLFPSLAYCIIHLITSSFFKFIQLVHKMYSLTFISLGLAFVYTRHIT